MELESNPSYILSHWFSGNRNHVVYQVPSVTSLPYTTPALTVSDLPTLFSEVPNAEDRLHKVMDICSLLQEQLVWPSSARHTRLTAVYFKRAKLVLVPEMIYTLASMTAPEASAHRGSVSQAHHDIIAFIAIIKSMFIISSSCHPRK